MPQVHNRRLTMMADSSAFGKNSRFMAAIRMTDGSKRRIRAFNTVENRLTKIKLRFFDRHSEIDQRRRERERQVIKDSLKKTLAYKLVVEKHNVTNAVDYQKALNDDYSAHALRYDVKHMIEYMEPEKVRERKAKALIEANRQRYENILKRNKNLLDVICPPKRTSRYLFDEDSLEKDEDGDETSRAPSNVEPGRAGDIFRRRSPIKPLLPPKKQAITRSFLLENAQKSMDVMDSNPSPTKPKPTYDLPLVQLHKKMPQSIAIRA